MSHRTRNGIATILLVEDNPGDVLLLQEAFEDACVECRIDVLSDGAAAVASLRQQAENRTPNLPALILLDLNLPKLDGHEVLRVLKAHPTLHRIPALMLTSSQAARDIALSYELHANAHLCKPADIGGYIELARMIESLWLKTVLRCGPSLAGVSG